MKAVPEEFTPEGKMICQNGNISTQENNVQSTSSCDANSNSNLGDFEQKLAMQGMKMDDYLKSGDWWIKNSYGTSYGHGINFANKQIYFDFTSPEYEGITIYILLEYTKTID